VFTVEFEKKSPWFPDLRELIAERPNTIPHGLGNSQTEVDFSVLESSKAGSDISSPKWNDLTLDDAEGSDDNHHQLGNASECGDGTADVEEEEEYSARMVEPEEDSDKEIITKGSKRIGDSSGVSRSNSVASKAARASKPEAATGLGRKGHASGRGGLELEFSEIVKSDAVMRQKQIDLAAEKARRETTAAEKGRAKYEYKKEKAEAKKARELRRLEEMRMRKSGASAFTAASSGLTVHDLEPTYSESNPRAASSSTPARVGFDFLSTGGHNFDFTTYGGSSATSGQPALPEDLDPDAHSFLLHPFGANGQLH
jgi:hypothetical protein